MAQASERVIPCGARLSVVRHLAHTDLFIRYAQLTRAEAKRIVRNEHTGRRPPAEIIVQAYNNECEAYKLSGLPESITR